MNCIRDVRSHGRVDCTHGRPHRKPLVNSVARSSQPWNLTSRSPLRPVQLYSSVTTSDQVVAIVPWTTIDATNTADVTYFDFTTTNAALTVTFEPQLPDASILASQSVVLLLTVAAAGYWWSVVVPSERAALGRSKRLGPLSGYLQELEKPGAGEHRWLERWFYTDWLRQREERRTQRQQQQRQQQQSAISSAAAASADPTVDGDKASADVYDAEHADDTNLLRPTAVTPTPRFFSLDNPIVATGALLLLAGIVAGLQQR